MSRTAVLLPVAVAAAVGHDANERGQVADRRSWAWSNLDEFYRT
jgi:hypothetical protein